MTTNHSSSNSLRRWLPLILVSSLGLFLELAVIRWLSVEVRLFAYFKNLPLLAAFLGLAIGFALVKKEQDYLKGFGPLLLIFVVLVIVFGRLTGARHLVYPSADQELMWFVAPLSYWSALAGFLGIVAVFFMLTMLLFIPLGQATGREMARHQPLPAYIVNIVASLLGTWAFSLVSFLETPPVVWFGLALVGLLGYFHLAGVSIRRDALIYAAILVGLFFTGRGVIWSPYQRLSISRLDLPSVVDGHPVETGYLLDVQQVFYQSATNLSDAYVEANREHLPGLAKLAWAYQLPYLFAPSGGNALIVGAGMGNDVSAALRMGMGSVDAVEIDPAIQRLGVELHPEQPYNDPRVHQIVDDARSYFVNNTKKYDVIAFGLLDSHILLSSLSSVRLDSYVYTLDSFAQARDHLAPGGTVSITFATTEWIEQRLGRMMLQVFGEGRVYISHNDLGASFIAGDLAPNQVELAGLSAWTPDPAEAGIPLPTDDWPYFYMRARSIPDAYWQVLLLVGVLTLLLMRRSFPEALRPDWHFWLLGAGFLLIEFTSVTRLALLFGTTWLVNALAISGVLLMVLGANLIVLWRQKINLNLIYGLLFASIVLVYIFPLDWLNQLPVLPKAVVGMVLLSLPLFFSGMIFSESLRRAGETARPLASNLTGSVAGGVLEYSSIWWGVQSLYLTAGVVYLLALGAYLVAGSKK